ncbi:MAG TPA: patatin-like phospholipase family protein [Sphingomonas sp.]|jgi:NTE family protein
MPLDPALSDNPHTHVALVLGGGNALGAYHAGVYQALHERGCIPDWIVGTSIGAVNGALIAGNPADRRIERLRDLWRPGDSGWWPQPDEETRRTAAALATLVGGRPGFFAPIGPLGSWWLPDPAAGASSLYDTSPLTTTLGTHVDFDLLNTGAIRFSALAVDVETGDEHVFDTTSTAVRADHLRASTALLPGFTPIMVDGRMLVDGGLSANLPLDPVLAAPPAATTLCIAVDLLPLNGAPPHSLGEGIQRMQDLMFAAQSRRSRERWREAYAAAPPLAPTGDPAAVTLVRLAYRDQEMEVAGKAMDFSPQSVAARWASGHRDATGLLDALAQRRVAPGAPGLTVYEPTDL